MLLDGGPQFTERDLWLLSSAGFFLLAAIWSYIRRQYLLAVSLLFAGAVLLRLLMAQIVPFVLAWDEQFHALVGRNMLVDPFRPLLYADPALPVDFRDWTANRIWLHKQPLFLWLIALSLKICGITPFAVKLPSALLSSLMVPAVFAIGKRVCNSEAGFLAAFFLAVSGYHLRLVTGGLTNDHNDVIFCCFVLFSVWAWVRYATGGTRGDLFLTGLLAGCAVLVKWLPGLLVFSGWGIWLFLDGRRRLSRRAWGDLLLAAGIALLVALSWQVYTLMAFPRESLWELTAGARHFREVVEGHGGSWTYHFRRLGDFFGPLVAWALLPALLALLVTAREKRVAVALLAMVATLEGFFLLAATKMPLFTLPATPLLLLAFGALLAPIGRRLTHRPAKLSGLAATALLVAGGYAFLDLRGIADYRTNRRMAEKIERRRLFETIGARLGDGRWVLFNCPQPIEFMFYTGRTAYASLPPAATLDGLLRQGWRVAVLAEGRRAGEPLLPSGVRVINPELLDQAAPP